ncbi:MAG: GNAT family N-acetyltransferase [Candidatus Zixiibacteriota bacterium]
MNIITYRELEPKDEIMMLLELAFWWPISLKDLDELINMDIRLRNSPVGFCAVTDGRLAGFVGVMDIPTKTVNGKTEIIGGIWAVATNPDFSRQGICKKLMDEAHNYFHKQKYRFSFLCTSRTIIAYEIYKKLGYTEVEYVNLYSSVYKVLDKIEQITKKVETELDPEKIYKIYEKFVENKTGFAVRQKDFVTLFAKRKRFGERKSIQKDKGYALVSDVRNVIKVQDMAALNDAAYGELIDEIEDLAKGAVIDRLVADERLLNIYKSRGYRVQKGDDGVLMVKNLTDDSIDKVYGESFYMAALDWF